MSKSRLSQITNSTNYRKRKGLYKGRVPENVPSEAEVLGMLELMRREPEFVSPRRDYAAQGHYR